MNRLVLCTLKSLNSKFCESKSFGNKIYMNCFILSIDNMVRGKKYILLIPGEFSNRKLS